MKKTIYIGISLANLLFIIFNSVNLTILDISKGSGPIIVYLGLSIYFRSFFIGKEHLMDKSVRYKLFIGIAIVLILIISTIISSWKSVGEITKYLFDASLMIHILVLFYYVKSIMLVKSNKS